VLVDSGNPGQGPTLLARLAEAGVRPQDLSLIVVTHAHPDHTGSLRVLKLATGAQVLVHRLDADPIRRGEYFSLAPESRVGWLFARVFPQRRRPPDRGVEPDIVLDDDEFSLAPYGIAGQVLHTPGHTPGSLSVLLDGGEALVGDLLMGALLAFGPPSVAFFAWSQEVSRASVRRVLERQPRTIITSHAGPFDPAEVRRRILRP
jgi:hydroxyacylglutathione hydrolase